MTAGFGEREALKQIVEQPPEPAEEEAIDTNNFKLGDGPLLQKMNRVSMLVSTVTEDDILYR